MADFETSASLSLEVSNRQLRQVRQEIEDELSDVALGLSPSMSAGAAGGAATGGDGEMSGRERRRRRREFRWARQRTGDMEDAVALLEDIEDKVGGGGGGAGFLDDIAGIGGDFASEIGGALPGLVANAVGSAVGTAVGQAISGNEVSVEDTEPLPVERRRQPVEDTMLEVEDTTLSVDNPSPLSVDDPSPLQVEDVPMVQVERPSWKIGVEQPAPIRVNVRSRGGGGGDGSRDIPDIQEVPSIQEETRRGAERGNELVPGFGILPGATFGFTRGVAQNIPGSKAKQRRQDSIRKRREALQRSGGGGGGTTTVQVQQQTDITANVDISVDTDQIVTETVDAFESEIQDLKREVDRDIQQLERRIQRATS